MRLGTRSTAAVRETRGVVPEAGSAIRVLRSPAVQHGVLWVALGGFPLVGLSTIWRTELEDS